MKVTPLEIRQKSFEKGFRGYEKEEVDAYLLTLSVEWEKMAEENRDFKHRIEQLEREVQKMRDVESSLYKTLKTAEDTGSHLVDQATKTAELLLKEAQMNADSLLNDSKYNAKNMVEEAEARAKNIIEEARDEVKISQREIKEIENIKENMLIELRGLANETIEKVNKIAAKTKKNQPTERKQEAPLFTGELNASTKSVEEYLKDTPSAELPTEPKVKTGSFFDNL